MLVAPPGTGKTTLVPLALADLVPGRVVVAEPRRVAARAAARRMSALLGEPPGRVAHTVRGESTATAGTRVEVVTTGVLVQRLQRDPELAGTDAVVLDECHERHLDTDLAVAFGVDVRAGLRPDLLLVAMSATAQAERLAAVLGGVPVVTAAGALHEVQRAWCAPLAPVAPAHGLRVDPRLLDHVAGVVRRALAEGPGDVLVFLPGAGEVAAVAGRLRDLPGAGTAVVPLTGRLSSAEQDAALTAGPGRRVVLSTAVAESSLTVPGVRAVVDAGLARVPRTDLARGMSGLATVPVSRASAEQRAGRAGREAPGRVYRCWSAADHDRLPAHPEAEISSADLTGLVLELACWGAPLGRGLALLDPLPAGAAEVATGVLRTLGAVGADGRATDRGRRLRAVGAHPRLARALLDAAPVVGARTAAEVVAVLADEGAGGAGTDDLGAVLRRLRAGADRAASARWSQEVRRLTRAAAGVPDRPAGGPVPPDLAAGLVVGLALPERLARRRDPAAQDVPHGGRDRRRADRGLRPRGRALARGRRGRPHPRLPGRAGAPGGRGGRADRPGGRGDAARRAGRGRLAGRGRAGPAGGAARRRRPARPAPGRPRRRGRGRGRRRRAAPRGARAAALDAGRARPCGERLAACRSGLGEPWPDVADDALLAALDLGGARSRADLRRLDVAAALRRLVPWSVAARLDEVAPERVPVTSGARRRVDYADPQAPTLAVRLQELLGTTATPRVAGRPLRLHLLSPAGRVVAVTSDLAGFWTTGYPSVRAELRGRYPRHAWPQDPAAAVAPRRARP